MQPICIFFLNKWSRMSCDYLYEECLLVILCYRFAVFVLKSDAWAIIVDPTFIYTVSMNVMSKQ
jgi:hypothetical protein